MTLGIKLAFWFLILSQLTQGQSIIKSFTFDSQDLDDWTSENLSPNNDGFWEWKENGKANGGTYWNDRDSIRSTSLGGAAVYDSDGLFSSGVGNSSLPVEVALNSPILSFSGELNVYLKFNQYYRNYDTDTRVEISIDNGTTWTIFNVNDNVNQNVETSSGDEKIIDVSSVLGGFSGPARARFIFSGDYYFWILDDVEFWDGYPYPETFPEYVGDSLVAFNVPFEVDTAAWPYVPNEIVVQFKEGIPEIEKQNLRDTLGAILVKSCVCNRLELWRLGDNVFAGGDTLSNFGGTIGVLERVKKSKGTSKVDGVDFNKYNYNQMENNIDLPNPMLQSVPNGITPTPSDAILIAILDTGVDFDHDSLKNFIYLNDDPIVDLIDNDGNCYVDDAIGWNFVDENNNPDDDHGHGTHVAGIVKKNLENYMGNECSFRIIPYKTHDNFGISSLFNVSCATYQAIEDGASVINDSWGFYGDSSIILNNAIDTVGVYDIIVVAASGNDSINLNSLNQYPACYSLPNVITVGSWDTSFVDIGVYDTLNAAFSNYDPICVDILGPGVDIESTLNNNLTGTKTGTSMATPAVSAAAALAYCSGESSFLNVKSTVLDCAQKLPVDVGSEVLNGNILNFDLNCLLSVSNDNLQSFKNNISIYPNPTNDFIRIQPTERMEDVLLEIYDLAGRPYIVKKYQDWESLETRQIDISNFPSGIYFLKIQHSKYLWSQRVIKF